MAMMNALTTYWLCRAPGADAEGPFTLGQIRKMYDSGAITAEGLVCRDGEDQWTGIDDEIAAVEMERGPVARAAPQKTHSGKAVRKRLSYGGCGLLVVALITGLFNPLFGIGLFLVALVVDFLSVKTVCSVCGNGVLKSSHECPSCKARLK